MRLIDADLLIEKLKNSIVTPNYHPDLGDAFQCMGAEEHNEEIICMIETVQEQATAYDVGKVTKQIKRLERYSFSNLVKLPEVIEIVKGAVKDE